ncbi:hypothetical protein [Halorussus sp. MSC15.2]|uniref:hypothetical protein n=1 Tax=Halorussus sp. MSC15.2 TaxID=2283638 RepID=UPI0013D70B73|nr:hypothetical protein [Halorussus sp. MSC15.2]NEU59225.1 hypothetical protein [Halorussus sp. MSC15.2]
MGYLGLGLPLTLLVIGGLYVVAAPSYLAAVQWTKTLVHYAKSPNHYDSVEEAAADADHRAFDTSESTQDLTGVARFYPRDHILELEDGSLVAFVELDPPHRDFAEFDDWYQTMVSIATWFNNRIDFDYDIHVTNRPFPIEQHLKHLGDRLDDSDVLGNPHLRALIEERLSERPAQFEAAGTQVSHFYLIVPLEETEVTTSSATDQTALEKLAHINKIGVVFEVLRYYVSGQRSQSADQQRSEMLRKLNRRLEQVLSLNRELEEYELNRLSTAEAFALQRGFWRPSEVDAANDAVQTRSQPAADGLRMEESNA